MFVATLAIGFSRYLLSMSTTEILSLITLMLNIPQRVKKDLPIEEEITHIREKYLLPAKVVDSVLYIKLPFITDYDNTEGWCEFH